jgi:murein DD-endopeptidase MepM/ murein hydrolase activator NlpD
VGPGLLLASLSALAGQGKQDGVQVAWRPARPLQGSLVLVGVRAAAVDSVHAVGGELAGEPLHFELIDGWFRAIGAVPLDAGAHTQARMVIERIGGARDTVMRSVAVARRRSPSERLRTNPDFVTPPDSVAPRLARERALVRDLHRRSHDVPRLWREPFRLPRPGPTEDGFGIRRIFNGRLRSRHLGVDFSGQRGDSVVATNRGVVAYAGDLYFSGTTIFLEHGAGLQTVYLHLSRVLVAPGDTVSPGQLIGLVGATGRVTGPHLHWSASYGSLAVDPLNLVPLDLNAKLP